jgi:hypothetical protein
MAISPKTLASWGLLSDSGGSTIQVTQVLQEMEITLAAGEPLAVELETPEISVELKEDQ